MDANPERQISKRASLRMGEVLSGCLQVDACIARQRSTTIELYTIRRIGGAGGGRRFAPGECDEASRQAVPSRRRALAGPLFRRRGRRGRCAVHSGARFWLSLNLPSMRAMGMRKPTMPASMVRRKPSGMAAHCSAIGGLVGFDEAGEQRVFAGFVFDQLQRAVGVDGDVIPGGHREWLGVVAWARRSCAGRGKRPGSRGRRGVCQ